jgi:hypothetical protein
MAKGSDIKKTDGSTMNMSRSLKVGLIAYFSQMLSKMKSGM